MRDRPLSASSIKTYLQCVLKYYYNYEDKKPRSGKSDPLAFGTAMHEALELLHIRIKETGKAPTPELYAEVIDTFMKSATGGGLQDMDTYQEGRDMLMSRLDKVDPEENVIGTELRFKLRTPKGTPFTGSIDKLVELDSETVVIIDYKTSRMALTQPEADSDIQLSMYDLAISIMFPQYKTIVCVFEYLRLSDVVTHRTEEQRATFIDFIDTVYNQIRDYEKENVKPSLNTFCPWCEFKSFCPEYKRVVEDPAMILPLLGELHNDDFVASWDLISSAKKIVDKRQREFKDEAYQRMRLTDTIKGKEREIYKIQSSRMNYDTHTVFDTVGPEEFVRMASVNKRAVDRYLQDNPQCIQAIEDTASFSFLSPSFRTRKMKPKKTAKQKK